LKKDQLASRYRGKFACGVRKDKKEVEGLSGNILSL